MSVTTSDTKLVDSDARLLSSSRYNKRILLGENSVTTKNTHNEDQSTNKEERSLGGSKNITNLKVQIKKNAHLEDQKIITKLDSNPTHENLAGTFDETFIQTKQDKGRQGLFIHEVGEHR